MKRFAIYNREEITCILEKGDADDTDTRIILDVDGTFIDSNDAHAKSWAEAMAVYGYNVAFEKVRPLIGMGGDKVLPQIILLQKDSEIGSQMSKRREAIFKEHYLPRLRAFPGAQELLQEMRERRLKLTIASSAQPAELAMVSLVGIEDLVGEKTSCKEVSRSKPDPDVMQVTLLRTGLYAHVALMIGDTAYDIEAARTAQVRTIAFRCGSWKDADLAGALALYDGPADLVAHYDESPLTG